MYFCRIQMRFIRVRQEVAGQGLHGQQTLQWCKGIRVEEGSEVGPVVGMAGLSLGRFG